MNNTPFSTCKNCGDRHSGCHSECPEYKEYKRRLDSLRPRPSEYVMCEYYIDKRAKMERRYGKI